MQCPRQQAEVVGLVDNIINGVSEHPEIFTLCDANALQEKRNKFEQDGLALAEAESRVAIAAAAKLESFRQLQEEMKNQIKLGVVNTRYNPEQLVYIGWGTKRDPQQIEIPSSPVNLRITAQGTEGGPEPDNGMLCFVWDKGRTNGGPVRSYIIERKQFNGDWSQWQFADTSYNNEIKLTKQPIGIKLWYQVRAGNASGQSGPTNTVAVVL